MYLPERVNFIDDMINSFLSTYLFNPLLPLTLLGESGSITKVLLLPVTTTLQRFEQITKITKTKNKTSKQANKSWGVYGREVNFQHDCRKIQGQASLQVIFKSSTFLHKVQEVHNIPQRKVLDSHLPLGTPIPKSTNLPGDSTKISSFVPYSCTQPNRDIPEIRYPRAR